METKAAQKAVRCREIRMTEQNHKHRADLTGLTKVPGENTHNIALLWHWDSTIPARPKQKHCVTTETSAPQNPHRTWLFSLLLEVLWQNQTFPSQDTRNCAKELFVIYGHMLYMLQGKFTSLAYLHIIQLRSAQSLVPSSYFILNIKCSLVRDHWMCSMFTRL